VERRFVPWEVASWEETAKAGRSPETPNRYGLRGGLSEEELDRVRGGGWDLPTLQRVVDQFVIHYDVAGVSRNCFRVLHDVRGLSIHFMLDVDGTIYQTLDVKERAWHATVCNDRSVGIEIANIGAYKPGPEGAATLARWYTTDAEGPPRRLKVPKDSVRTPGLVGYPLRSEPVHGVIQGQELVMYDLTREQYDSLIKLTATLCTVLPRIECDYPRGADGKLVSGKLDESALTSHSGLIGHFHIQENKIDPGPAFQWDLVVDSARALMQGGSQPAVPQLTQ
jgi:N-acetyl-anhydromuramyl-L-alanine amidase AmpD